MKQETKYCFTESDVLEILQEHVEKFYDLPKGTPLKAKFRFKQLGDVDKGTYSESLDSLVLTVISDEPKTTKL